MERSTRKKHNPVTFYLRSLLYTYMAVLLRLVALSPIAALFVFPAGSPYRYAALLCPVAIALLILPLRFSLAEALVQRGGGRYFSFDTALSLSDYGDKLGQGLWHLVSVAKWALPLLAALVWAYFFQRDTDALSVLRAVTELGKTASGIINSVCNFFIGIFGGEPMAIKGDLMAGVYAVLAVIALCALILIYGVVRNSAYRYIWAVASRRDKNPRTEARRRLRGCRMKQLGVALINLVLLLPPIAVAAVTLKGVVSDLSGVMMEIMTGGGLSIKSLTAAVWPLLFAFFALYLPLLPIRRCLTAFFAARAARRGTAQPAASQTPGGGEPEGELLSGMMFRQPDAYQPPERMM